MTRAVVRLAVFATVALLLVVPTITHAQATLLNSYGGPLGFGSTPNCLGINDDGSSNVIDLTPAFPSGLRFFSNTQRSAYVNTNGNITFAGPLPIFTPNPFPVASQPMIAPFWADVDTRTGGGGFFGMCNGPGDGVPVMGPACDHPPLTDNGVWWHLEAGLMVVTWDRVGYYRCHHPPGQRDSFQLVLRAVAPSGCGGSSTAGTDFDVEFRYQLCQWETGDASGGTGGFGGTPAQAGFDEGIGAAGNFTEIMGSRAAGIAARLCSGSNTVPPQPGIWQFQIRNGVVMTCPGAGMACTVPGTMGVCSQGRTSCPAGSSTPMCVQQIMPNPERCNGLDDDCDGLIDETDLGNLCGAFQVCRMGACVDGCFEGNCPSGFACDMGRCVDPLCIGVTCMAGQRCVMGTCRPPCEGVTCPHGQMCTTGRCVDPCANIMCDPCTACVNGSCVPRCTATNCPSGQSCNAAGLCVETACLTTTCGAGTYCSGGTCMDACVGATCPFGQTCTAGECVPMMGLPDGGSITLGDAFFPGMDANFRDAGPVVMGMDARATGDSGVRRVPPRMASCGCRTGSDRAPLSALVLAVLGLFVVRARRGTRAT